MQNLYRALVLATFLSVLAPAMAIAQGGGMFSTYTHLYRRPRLSPFSVEFGAGSAYYAGDLVKPFNISAQNNLLNLSFALGIRYQVTDFISLRGTLTYFRLKATSDRTGTDWEGKSFQSNNLEGALELVHDILPKRWTEEYRTPVNAYVFGGVGLLRFQPRSTETGEKFTKTFFDKPATYNHTTLCFPVGFGINYHFFEDSWIGFEAGYRFTNTDWLDNASFPGYSNLTNDGYYIYGFRASLQLYKGYAVGKQ